MHTANFYAIIAFAAATASAQSTTTATVLVPDWCVSQAQPTVTVLGQQDALTTYSYICPTSAVPTSSALSHASAVLESARSRASEAMSRWESGARVTAWVRGAEQRRSFLDSKVDFRKRDEDCFGWNVSFDGCIPWEITQGESTWAVHYTVAGVRALDQECSFGSGGVASGPATCTATGRLDASVWGTGDGTRTRTFSKTDVDRYWIRNTVPVTVSATSQATGSSSTTTGTASSSGVLPAASAGALSSGVGVPKSIPTGAVAMAVGAGGIFAAALAL